MSEQTLRFGNGAAVEANRLAEAELVDELAKELGVAPVDGISSLAIRGTEHSYPLVALLLAHVRLMKGAAA